MKGFALALALKIRIYTTWNLLEVQGYATSGERKKKREGRKAREKVQLVTCARGSQITKSSRLVK